MAMASATVARNASAPRRSTIPAIANVFRGPGRRCVINNPTPRLCKNSSVNSETSLYIRKKRLPGSPLEVHKISGQPYDWNATCMRQQALNRVMMNAYEASHVSTSAIWKTRIEACCRRGASEGCDLSTPYNSNRWSRSSTGLDMSD